MKKLLLLLLVTLLSCDSESQNPALITSTTNTTYIDGGQMIFLNPPAQGGDVGEGFTNTGLYPSGSFSGGKRNVWSMNHGSTIAGAVETLQPSIVQIELDMTQSGGGAGDRFTATKVREIFTNNLSTSSAQGLIVRNDGNVWIVSGGVREITNVTADAVNSIQGTTFVITNGGSNLGYDTLNDEALNVDTNGILKAYDFTGTIITGKENLLDLSAFTVDHIYLDLTNDLLSISIDPTTVRFYRWSTKEFLDTQIFAVGAIEGLYTEISPYDGKLYIIINSDGYFHQAIIANSDLQINAIFKFELILP